MRTIKSVEEMRELGRKLGASLRAGDLVLLSGPLGSGKTALAQGIGIALGFTGITSPTFVISKIYKGSPNLIHVDAYRLQGEASAIFDDLDLESYLPKSVTIVEWGEGLVNRISDKYFEVKIKFGTDENERLVEFVDQGLGVSI